MPKPDKQPPANHVLSAPMGTLAWTIMPWQRSPTLPVQWIVQGPHRVIAFSLPNPAAPTADSPQRENLKLAPEVEGTPRAFVADPSSPRWLFLGQSDAPNPTLVAYLTQEAAQGAGQAAERAALLAAIETPPAQSTYDANVIRG